jgi:hypothetical protein
MPGPFVHVGATVTCAHAGQAMPVTPNPRVLVGGQPTVLLSTPYTVAGCSMPPPPAGNGPCVTAQWLVGSTRVLSTGLPLVVQSSQAICVPTGTPLIVVATQPRASGV